MKTLAICNTNIKRMKPESSYFDFSLFGENLIIGLLDNIEQANQNRLKDDEVMVKIKAFSCNYRDKALMLKFNNSCKRMSKQRIYFYSPFGSEFVAEVIYVGKNIKKIKIGDRVIPNGTYPCRNDGGSGGLPSNYASQRIQYFKENQVSKIPDAIPDEVGASFTIAAQTVYSMIRRLELHQNSKVLISAATSNTSLSAINVLSNRGIKTYAISKNEHFENQLLNLGIHQIIPYSALDKITVKEHMDIKFDAIIDPFFDIYITQIIKYLKCGGKYIYCGFYNQSSLFDPINQLNEDYVKVLTHCMINNISIIGNCLGIEEDLQNALDDYVEGKYNILIDSTYTGNDIIPFLKKTFHELPRFGKVVYKYDD